MSLLILLVGEGHAQQNYFVLIQADNNQPFYVKMGTKSFSSTAKGRLILSQLKEGSLSFNIGFPRQLFPEQQFTINVDKDLEFQLKDLGEKGWALFNPQTLELKAPDKKEGAQDTKSEGIRKDDAFSRLMAGVVSDTAVMYNTYAMEEVLKDSPVVAVPEEKDTMMRQQVSNNPGAIADSKAGTDNSGTSTAVVNKGEEHAESQGPPTNEAPGAKADTSTKETSQGKTKAVTKETPAGQTAGAIKGTVVKLSERKTPKGLRLAYADKTGGKKADTIVVIIPMDTTKSIEIANQSIKRPSAAIDSSYTATQTQTPIVDTSRSIAAQTSQSPEAQKPPEPLFRTRADTVRAARPDSIVHTSSDTIHVYLAPHRKTDTTNLSANSNSPRNPVNRAKSDSTRNAVSKAKPGVAHNAVNKIKPDSTHTAINKLKPDSTHNVIDKAKPDSNHTVINKSKSDSIRSNAFNKTRSDSAHNNAFNKTRSDSTHNNAFNKTRPDTTHNNPFNKTRPDTPQTTTARNKPVMVNSDCRNFATDYDVDKLRVKMLEGAKEDERTATAKKVFKTKCFTTKQIKALSEVFTTDAGKFRFLEAAYPSVSDDHFRDLTDLLTDPVYNGRFKAMTGQR